MKYLMITALAFGILLMPRQVLAQYYSQGSSNYSIVIDKKVKSGSMTTFVDNMAASTYIFRDGGAIEFKIVVENSGSLDLTNISVKDILPDNLSLQYYPGTLTNKTIAWTIDRLSPGEQKSFSIRALIKVDKYTGKQTNYVETWANGVSDSDTATYYIEKAIVPVTGSSDLVVKTVLIVLAISGGVTLRKVARGY